MGDVVDGWKDWVDRYERGDRSSASPYDLKEDRELFWDFDALRISADMSSGKTLKEIRLQLAKEEYQQTEDGDEIAHEDSPSAFVSMGLSIEEVQYVFIYALCHYYWLTGTYFSHVGDN